MKNTIVLQSTCLGSASGAGRGMICLKLATGAQLLTLLLGSEVEGVGPA